MFVTEFKHHLRCLWRLKRQRHHLHILDTLGKTTAASGQVNDGNTSSGQTRGRVFNGYLFLGYLLMKSICFLGRYKQSKPETKLLQIYRSRY